MLARVAHSWPTLQILLNHFCLRYQIAFIEIWLMAINHYIPGSTRIRIEIAEKKIAESSPTSFQSMGVCSLLTPVSTYLSKA
jgi:hypothetical protein